MTATQRDTLTHPLKKQLKNTALPRGLQKARRGADFFNHNDFQAKTLILDVSIEDSSRSRNFVVSHFESCLINIDYQYLNHI